MSVLLVFINSYHAQMAGQGLRKVGMGWLPQPTYVAAISKGCTMDRKKSFVCETVHEHFRHLC